MKTKFYLTSLALAAIFAGCSNEELITDSYKADDGLVEIGDNFLIASVGAQANTRTHWGVTTDNTLRNAYLPTWNATNASASVTDLSTMVIPDEIGICWTGVDAKGTGSVSASVYTNYQFIHYGWLGKGQTAPDFDKCSSDPKLDNGWLYSELGSSETNIAKDAEIDPSKLTGTSKSYDGSTLAVADLNTNSGVYKTDNKAIFGGDYIAYYPYNSDFKDAGAIPAKAVMTYNNVLNGEDGIEDVQLGKATFRYAYAKGLVGGANASGFEFKNLSGLIRVYLESNDGTALAEKIDQVLLYSESASFNEQVSLSASAIAAQKTGAELYASVDKKSNAILANIAAGAMGGSDYILPSAKGAKTSYITVAALPATITDLKVLAHDQTSGKWAEIAIGNYTVTAGALKSITATMKSTDFKAVYYAVDQMSLTTALSAAGTAATANDIKTVRVLGNITISTDNTTIPANVSVENGKIIVPEDVTFILSDGAIMKSTVNVEGQTCCGSSSNAGALTVNAGAMIAGTVNVLASDTEGKEAGSLTFAYTTGKKSTVAKTATIVADGDVIFNGVTDILGTLTLNEGATATVAAANGDVNAKGGTVNNSGTFEVLGKFAMLDASGSTVAAAGKNFKNNGTFIDNVGSTIGGGTQSMVFGTKGEYICKVDGQARLDEAYQNKTACSTIQIIGNNSTSAYSFDIVTKHGGKDLNIIVDATGVNFEPVAALTIGNLTVNATKDLTVNATEAIKDKDGNTIGWKSITVNGDINIAGAFTTAEDVRNMTAKNMTVVKDGAATFGNRDKSNGNTLAVAGTIEVKKDGEFTITTAATGKNIADVTCTKLVEGGTFNGKPVVK
ncbi:hypothetical protein [Bacteroides sp.]|uniref:hypothetical protein n=1 Tax=Bacteroides sp. TaxID=29523 RepID=UPI003AB5D4C9